MSNPRVVSQTHASAKQQQLSIAYKSLTSLKPNPRNPRIHSEKQVRQIAQSIRTFGFNVPILVDRELNVIAGHGRVAAAVLLHMEKVPIIRLEHLSEHQRRAFMIADNRLTENALWDDRVLGEQLKILSEAEIDFSLETTGFEMGEIDIFIEGASGESEADCDAADLIPEESGSPLVSSIGDCWLLGKHRVVCGNALDPVSYATLMAVKKAAMVFTDPPYNVRIDGHASGLGRTHHADFAMASGEMSAEEFTSFLSRSLGAAASHCVNGSIHYVCMDWRHLGELLAAGKAVYGELKNLCVWAKDNAGMGSLYRSQHELVLVFKHGENSHRNNIQLGAMGRYRTNVWHYPGIGSFGRSTSEGNLLELHPTVKPVALVADAILDCSARGEIVLDPFLGSGTTVIAAERTGRICYGIEIDPPYVDTIVRRWQAFTGKSAEHEASGRSFREIEETVNVR
ncbi:MAG TPA: DNA methyltransferase [Acidobacteriaceae bacterium]|jgi:DNA modification methylase|nr:DNA methyltransferase [Acidobacteriaceae bacterium]